MGPKALLGKCARQACSRASSSALGRQAHEKTRALPRRQWPHPQRNTPLGSSDVTTRARARQRAVDGERDWRRTEANQASREGRAGQVQLQARARPDRFRPQLEARVQSRAKWLSRVKQAHSAPVQRDDAPTRTEVSEGARRDDIDAETALVCRLQRGPKEVTALGRWRTDDQDDTCARRSWRCGDDRGQCGPERRERPSIERIE
jgi:hypothetical protein